VSDLHLWADDDARRHAEDMQAWRDDHAELPAPAPWPPPHWAQHPRRCRTDHGLPDICRCGKGWT